MLSRQCRFEDLDTDQWNRLSALALAQAGLRSLYVVHRAGRVLRCVDSRGAEEALPFDSVEDAQSQAEALLAQRRPAGVDAVWVLDLDAYRAALAAQQKGADVSAPVTAQLAREWEQRFAAGACAVAPRSEFLYFGLPWARLERFAARMLPPTCTFVLGVFDGEALWATCFAQFQEGSVVCVSTSAALDPEDVKDVVGLDQHPFLLAAVANRYKRPAFGWFCSRADFEAWMLAPGVADKEEIFQKAMMAGRAVFDFNILLDRGLTVLGPINPGEAALAGADRESNPRTKTPDPADAGPSAV
jgi:hypothetical protein